MSLSRVGNVHPDDRDTYPGVGSAVQAILASQAEQDTLESLHRRAEEHLKIFEDPRYSHLDTPQWVTRIWPEEPVYGRRKFTVRNAVKAMYDTAEDLGLDRLGGGSGGRRYVAAAICACVADADAEFADSELAEAKEKEEAYARALQRLASTWAAFLMWPFYAHGWQEKRVFYPERRASPLATPSWFGAPVDETVTENSQKHPITLEETVLSRDGYRCVLCGHLDRGHCRRLLWAGCTDLPKGRQDDLKTVNFFKRSLVVYSSPSGSESGRDEFDSMAVTLEILQLYFGLDRKYVDDMKLMDAPQNAIAVNEHFRKRFEYLTLCLKPIPIPHCYEVTDYEPTFNHLDLFRVPSQITFKSHTPRTTAETPIAGTASPSPSPGTQTPGSEFEREALPEAMDVDSASTSSPAYSEREPDLLPDPELIRLHAALAGVLHKSGAYKTFDYLFQPLSRQGHSAYPAPGGNAFWRSVVEYEGEESCVEVELQEAAYKLRQAVREGVRVRETEAVDARSIA